VFCLCVVDFLRKSETVAVGGRHYSRIHRNFYSLSKGKWKYYSVLNVRPTPVDVQCKALGCARSSVGIAGSNPARGHGCSSFVFVV